MGNDYKKKLERAHYDVYFKEDKSMKHEQQKFERLKIFKMDD
jgi:hypothetical protein